MLSIKNFLLLSVISANIGICSAATIYNENLSGDLPNSGLGLTPFTLTYGANEIFGAVGKSTAGVMDRDYFAVTVPVGLYLDSITLLAGTTTVNGNLTFIGMQAGNQVTNPVNGNANELLGYYLYGPTDVTLNILPKMNTTANGASGFATPLPAGDYAFWIQEGLQGTFNYGLNFNVVPSPSTLSLLACGSMLLGFSLSRKKNI